MPYSQNTETLSSDQGPSILELRQRLLANGYVPLPARGKAVKLSGWQHVQPNAEQVRAWTYERPGDVNTGIRLGSGLVALDIDVLDRATSRQLAKKFETLTKGKCLPPLRIGRAPKCLLLARVDEDGPKMTTGDFYDEDGQKSAVEVLADGQQFIAYGIHPDTGKPYHWAEGFDPLETPKADLPTIKRRELAQYVSYAERVLRQNGLVQKGQLTISGDRQGKGKSGESWETITDALSFIPNDDCDWDTYSKIGMALHEESGGSDKGLEAFMKWSAQSKKHIRRATARRWDSFMAGGDGNIGGGTILYMARQHGWGEVTPDDFLEDEDANGLIDRATDKSALLTFTAPADLTIATARKPIIKGLVAAGDIGCIVGAPGVGKSLIAPRLAWAVAQGQDMFGLRIRQSSGVFYVAAEDEHGMRARMMALRNSLGDAPSLRLVGGASDLLSKNAPQLKALRAAVKVECPALVIIDTLAMAFPGLEENSAEGMGLVVAAARSLAQWGAAVLLVHHDTKDGQQGLPRGHSLLNGALDVSLHLKRGENGVVRGTLTKNRNGSCDLDIAFRIGVATLGQDVDGEDVRAAICEPLGITDEVSKPKLTQNERAALAALRGVASGNMASFDEWRDACVKGTEVFSSADQKARRARFAECRKGLIQKERIRHDDDVVELLDAALFNAADFKDDADE